MALLFTLSIVVSATLSAQPATDKAREILAVAAAWRDSVRTMRLDVTQTFKHFSGTRVDTNGIAFAIVVDPDDTLLGARVRYDDGMFRRTYDRGRGQVLDVAGSELLDGNGEEGLNYYLTAAAASIASTLAYGRNPFRRALDVAISIESLGRRTIGGLDCHVVRVVTPDFGDYTSPTTIWFLLPEGRPMRYEKDIWWEGMVQRETVDIREIAVNVPIDERGFDLTREQGARVVALESSETDSQEDLLPGQRAPSWQLHDSSGGLVRSEDWRDRVVVVNFWGTWCAPCVRELPELQKLNDEFRSRDVEVIALSANDPDGADPAALFRRKGLTMRMLVGADSVASAFRVRGFPRTFIVGPDGTIADVQRGSVNASALDRMRAVIEGLLQK